MGLNAAIILAQKLITACIKNDESHSRESEIIHSISFLRKALMFQPST